MSDVGTLAGRVEDLAGERAIELDSVDFTVRQPNRLRTEFDEVLHYFALVEGEVAQNALDIAALLPKMAAHDRQFLDVWSQHEAAHALIFDSLCDRLGLGPVAPPAPEHPQGSFRVFGALAEIPWVHDVLMLVYLTRGAMHEHLTLDGYGHLGQRFSALGETALVRTMVEPIRRQEARHLGYYRMAAAAHRRLLTSMQVRVARVVSISTYRPVGANTKARRSQCGRVFASLAGDQIRGILEPVQAIGELFLGDGATSLPPFVSRAMERCMAESA